MFSSSLLNDRRSTFCASRIRTEQKISPSTRLVGWLPVHQPLTARLLDRLERPVSVIVLPGIPKELKLPQVAAQVLFGDVVERPDNAPLQQRVIGLCEVRVEDQRPDVGLAVIDRVMAGEVLADTLIAKVFVGDDVGRTAETG